MIQKISDPVSVTLTYSHQTKKSIPRAVVWKGRLHAIARVGLHHTYREGRVLFHVFSVATNTLFLRLVLNTENLQWKLEEIASE